MKYLIETEWENTCKPSLDMIHEPAQSPMGFQNLTNNQAVHVEIHPVWPDGTTHTGSVVHNCKMNDAILPILVNTPIGKSNW